MSPATERHDLDDALRKNDNNKRLLAAARHIRPGRADYPIIKFVRTVAEPIGQEYPTTYDTLLRDEITQIVSIWPTNRLPHPGCRSVGAAAWHAELPVTVIERVTIEPYETALPQLTHLVERLAKNGEGICYTRLFHDWHRLRYRHQRDHNGHTVAGKVHTEWLNDYAHEETNHDKETSND